MKKQRKTIITISVIIIMLLTFLVLFLNPFGLFRVGGMYLEEEGQHFKVGTTIPTFHFYDMQPNTPHRFQMWHPTQSYPQDPPGLEYFFTSDGGGNHNVNCNLYLNHDGDYNCNLDRQCNGGWCTCFGGGRIISDSYRAYIDIISFTISPSTVTVGDEVTISWTVKNNGEFNGDYDWSVYNPWDCEYMYTPIASDQDIVLDIGDTHSDSVTLTVTDDMAHHTHPEVILFGLKVYFYGSDTQYPPEWYTVWGNNDQDARCEGIIYNPPDVPPDIDITYSMTVLTFPNNCDVNMLGVGVMNSGDDGIAVFEDVPYGSYAVTVSKAGHASFTKTVFLDSDTVISMDLTSQKYLMPMLLLIIAGIITVVVVYCHKKKIIRF